MGRDSQLDFFIDTLRDIKTKKAMNEFLVGIFTPQELEEIPTRLEIVKRLKQGISHHVIAEALHVGVATVTRGSKEIQKGRFRNI